MPFFSFANLKSSLSTNISQNLVDSLLPQLQIELEQLHLQFDPISLVTDRLVPNSAVPTSVLFCNPTKLSDLDQSSMIIKDDTSPSFSLIPSAYSFIYHPRIADYIIGIELNNLAISAPTYLELKAKFGIYIDTSNSSDKLTVLVRSALCRYLNKVSSFDQTNYQTLTSSRTASSSVSFSKSQNYEYYSSLLTDPDFEFLRAYIVC